MKIGVLSDTHGWIHPGLLKFFNDVDEIWHAGDIGGLATADSLSALKPLKAVHGNIDDARVRLVYPAVCIFTVEKKKVLLTHIAGTPGKYVPDIRKLIVQEKPDILVCGHSHITKVMFDKNSNLLYINPGAAGFQGFHSVMTAIRFRIEEERIFDLEVIELGERGKVNR
ncbi:MAG: metallophosphoesterase family protein [Bacteroidales bacterium]